LIESENFDEFQKRIQEAEERRRNKLYCETINNFVNSDDIEFEFLMRKNIISKILEKIFPKESHNFYDFSWLF
jgi:hypothetical protein